MGSHPLPAVTRALLVALATAFCSLAFAGLASAGTYTVTQASWDNGSEADCPADAVLPACTIAEAFKAVNTSSPDDDVIVLSVPGTYDIQATLTSLGSGSGKLTITGLGASTILDGTNTPSGDGRVFRFNGENVVNNLTITGGHDSQDGGAVKVRQDASLELNNVLVTENDSGGRGGAISVHNGANLVVNNSRFVDNTAGSNGGGAIAVDSGGEATVNGSNFKDNQGDNGGGIYVEQGGELTATDTTFDHNEAVFAGGAVNNFGKATFTNCTFVNNEVGFLNGKALHGSLRPGSGGAVATFGTEGLTVTGSTFATNHAAQNGGALSNQGVAEVSSTTFNGNTAGEVGPKAPERLGFVSGAGGAIDNGGDMSLVNVTVSGNEAESFGGGINNTGDASLNTELPIEQYCLDPKVNVETLDILNSTITLNRATIGGGVNNEASDFPDACSFFKNTIVADNSALKSDPNCGNDGFGNVSNGHNLDSGNQCEFDQATDLVNTNPVLGPLANNSTPQTHALLAGSPALNSADNAACPPTDERGVTRPQEGVCDRGAYEFQPAAAQVPPAGAPPAAVAPAVDSARPRVRVAGLRTSGCTSSSTVSVSVRITDASSIASIRATLDGRRVSVPRRKRFTLRLRNLKAGRHTLRIVTTDSAGNRTTTTRRFAKCAQAAPRRQAPRFTG